MDSLEKIAADIENCTKCSLYINCGKRVPGTGSTSPKLFLLGEAPGRAEAEQGLPFVGRSGQLLTKMIEAMGLKRDVDTFISNINHCRPPDNRTPTIQEMDSCVDYVYRQIDLLRPKVICTLGKTAAIGLKILDKNDSLSSIRGKILKYKDIPVVSTYHPSYLLRSPNEKPKAWEDLKIVRNILNG